MGTTEFDGVKGFLPQEEALQLLEWASQGALIGPLLEIGSYCGLSTLWLAKAARAAKTVVFAVDHHRGSEEHQAGEFPRRDADRSGGVLRLSPRVPTQS